MGGWGNTIEMRGTVTENFWLASPCDYCGAAPYEQCKTATGGRASTHGGRTAIQAAAYQAGFADGLDDNES